MNAATKALIKRLKDHAWDKQDRELSDLIDELEDLLSETQSGGDYVGGNSTTVGDISGSKGVAIGSGNNVTIDESERYSETTYNISITELKEQAREEFAVAAVDYPDIAPPVFEEAQQIVVDEIVPEAAKGEEADTSFIEERIRNLARMGPDILNVATKTMTNPALGLVEVVRLVANKVRAEEGLEPIE